MGNVFDSQKSHILGRFFNEPKFLVIFPHFFHFPLFFFVPPKTIFRTSMFPITEVMGFDTWVHPDLQKKPKIELAFFCVHLCSFEFIFCVIIWAAVFGSTCAPPPGAASAFLPLGSNCPPPRVMALPQQAQQAQQAADRRRRQQEEAEAEERRRIALPTPRHDSAPPTADTASLPWRSGAW